MASFCKQCSLELFGKDYEDMLGLTTEQDEDKDQFAVVLCEGCGPIQVDKSGSCISYDCLKGGHNGHSQIPLA